MNISGTSRWRWLITVSLFVLAGLVLRIPGMRTDFWLDEIWTLYIVHHQVRSVVDVFTVARVDNNHPLNTLLMYEIGDWAAWWVYRIPALLAGLGAIGMAMRIAERRGRPHAIAAGVLFAISFPMILYSTEARGYGLMIFFTLWMVDVFDGYRIDHRGWRCVSFAIAVVLGLLANFAFVLGYAAVWVWSVWEMPWRRDWRKALKRLVMLHGVMIVFIVVYFLGFIGRMQVGGSSGDDPANVVKQSLGFAIGLSNGVNGTVVAAIAALLIGVAVVAIGGRKSRGVLAFFVSGIWVIPAVILIAGALHGDRWINPRHFLAPMILLLLAGAFAFGECWRRGGAWKIGAGLVLAGVVGGNITQDMFFARLGRGHYLDGLNYMLAHNDDHPALVLCSDSPNRTQMILDFYWRYVPHDVGIQYVMPADVAGAKPNWYIDESDASEDKERVIGGLRYVRRAAYPCYGLSGESWTIYQRVDQ